MIANSLDDGCALLGRTESREDGFPVDQTRASLGCVAELLWPTRLEGDAFEYQIQRRRDVLANLRDSTPGWLTHVTWVPSLGRACEHREQEPPHTCQP